MQMRVVVVSAALGASLLSGCATSGPGSGSHGVVQVAASTNVWGSILAQLGGSRVHATSIITNPATDPHDYEPAPGDARAIAEAKVFVENGIGYDSWAAKAIAANGNPSQLVVDVGAVTGTPSDGNPHRWYSPTDVDKVAAAITADLKKADPKDAAYFDDRLHLFENAGLATYHQLINQIRDRYAGTPVGASESIFAPLADALNLNLLTPPSFLKAISEGIDPTAADKQTVDRQISQRQIKVYVFNSQNSTPDVAAQVAAARKQGIPIVAITETLSPAGATFQAWQVAQLTALRQALAKATGR